MANDKQKSKSGFSATKAGGYAAQKKYHANNDNQRGKVYEPKIRVQIAYKDALLRLCDETGMSLTVLCLTALEEKYGVTLQKPVDSDSK